MAKKKTTTKTSKAPKVPTITAGEEIDLEAARNYVKEYIDLKKKLQDKVLTKVTQSERDKDEILQKAEKHFGKKMNAFIFSKSTITRFFDPTLNNGQEAEYLVVFFAAKYKNSDAASVKSSPTVVLAGLNSIGNDEYASLNIPAPATEQPPSKIEYQFPNPKNKEMDQRLIVKLK